MANKAETYSAIVVDDEVIVRTMLTFALERAGFSCDCAAAGVEASSLLSNRSYDLVVTDLRMPRKHGHSLVLEILAVKDRPAIMVHTSIEDPRLLNDLLLLGVDDILYKPTDYALFAARARILVEQRRGVRNATDVPRSAGEFDELMSEVEQLHSQTRHAADANRPSGLCDAARLSPFTLTEVMSKLKHLSTVLPMSSCST